MSGTGHKRASEYTSPTLPSTLSALLSAAVEHGRDRDAVVGKRARLTYGELSDHVEQLAQALRMSAVTPGDRVAILLPNCPEFVIALWGTVSAGAIAVPLHVKFQAEEIGRYLKDCAVQVILADRRMEPAVRILEEKGMGPFQVFWRIAGRIGFTGPDGETLPTGSLRLDDDGAILGNSPALSQYSTGSTGSPKRVTRTHGQLVEEAANVTGVMNIGPGDRILGVAPLFHSYGFVNAMLCAVAAGATLVTMEEFIPREALRLIASEKVTGFPAVPFMINMLSETFVKEEIDVSSLRYCLSAGAPLPPETASMFERRFGVPVRQLYGTTETGVLCINRGAGSEGAMASVGAPIPGTVVEIQDDEGHPVPPGVEGNVAIRSVTGALGYDRAVVETEFGFRFGAFYPGDVGRTEADGRLYLTGRKRFFINVGGTKVDPSEVEAVLLQHPLVDEAVVVGVPSGAAGEVVKAVVVTSSPCDASFLADHCRGKLAEHKRPRIIEFRPEIPKSPLGKVLRKYLIEN